MNKHKYKKRRARDKFKRLNLQNIKDRKQRAKRPSKGEDEVFSLDLDDKVLHTEMETKLKTCKVINCENCGYLH